MDQPRFNLARHLLKLNGKVLWIIPLKVFYNSNMRIVWTGIFIRDSLKDTAESEINISS